MRRIVSCCLLLLLLASCAAPAEESPPETPEVPAEAAPAIDETGKDDVLLTLEAPLADGRTLTLEAFGKTLDEYSVGVREVRVYEGENRMQTVSVREATEPVWNYGSGMMKEEFYDYTSCWSPEDSMMVQDLNFDGNMDLCLFGWAPNNTIPYYCWLWDPEAEQYQYAFTLQVAGTNPETKETTAEYKSGSAGSQYITEYYKPDGNGQLFLDRIERNTCDFELEEGNLDYQAEWVHETWIPPEGAAPIQPGSGLNIEDDLILVRREIPLYEIHDDDTLTHYREIWERKDGELQLTSREERGELFRVTIG